MSELCTWQYSRHSYCVVMHDNEQPPYLQATRIYYSPGAEADTGAEADEIADMFGGIPVQPFSDGMLLEDDDSVQALVQKTSLSTLYRPEHLYFWIEGQSGPVNMRFDLLYNIDAHTSRRFNYDVIPSSKFKEQLTSESDWQDGQRVVTQMFENSFLDSFDYADGPVKVKIIHCMPLNKYALQAALEGEGEATLIKYQVKTYFPELRVGAPIISNIIADPEGSDAIVKYNENDVTFKTFKNNLVARNNSIRAIQSPGLNKQLGADKSMHFYDCNVLEAVVHINYRENNDNFVDLEKVFRMFPVSVEVPFARLKTEKDTNFMVYREATNEKSEHYINKRTLQDWVDPKLSRIMDITDVHAVAALSYSRNVGRGLSFKIFNYGDTPDEKRYMTLNIYKDGKIELKCFWDENFGADELNPGGNRVLLVQAISKVRRFIEELNNLNYSTPGSRKSKITVPDADPFDQNGNIRVAFFNTISVFDFGEELNYPDFTRYLEQFRSYIHLVTRLMPNNEIDTRSVELRYKRLHNYVHLKNIQRFIKNYKSEHTQMDAETKQDLKNAVAVTFSLTKEDAEVVIADYEATFENKKRRSRKTVSKDDVSRILNRDISTQSGIDIKIIKRQPKSMTDHTYKCLILGISYEMLGPIYHFLRHVIFYFKNHERLANLEIPGETNYLSALRVVKDQTAVEDIQQGTAATKAEVKVSLERKVEAAVAIGEAPEDLQELEFDWGEDEDVVAQGSEEEPIGLQEPGAEEEPLEEVPPATPTPVAKPTAKVHAVTTMVSSFLDLLQARVKEAYSDSIKMAGEPTPYSTKCQKSEGRQPLVIPVDLARSLKQYVAEKVKQLEEQKAAATGAKREEVMNQLYEFKIHQQTLERGLEYKPQAASTTYFYFCPLSWNMDVNTPDSVDRAFPAYDMNPRGVDEAKNKYLYMSPKRKFKAGFKGNYRNWVELVNSNRKLEGEPPHASYVRFIQTTADYSACRACCFVNKKDTPETAKCLGKSTIPAAAKGTSSASYIKSEGKFVEENRFAFIPEKLNRIFNLDDDGLKIVSSANTTISTGFSYYLRKGTKDGKFINAIRELTPKIPDLVPYLAEVLQDDPEIYKSLKKGAINQLFAPEKPSNDPENDTLISMENFISFLETRSSDINEDFLWDLLSRQDVILPAPAETGLAGGLNIIICEVHLSGKRGSEVDTGIIKCPVGFQLDDLFNPDRPSIILYRYKDNYEIICHVEEDNKDIISNPLFEPGHPLITDIINHLMTKCHTFPNIKAEQELQRHIENMQRHSVINRTLVGKIDLVDIHEALRMLKAANIERYLNVPGSPPATEPVQIVDSHNKVTHIKLTNNHWLPIKPSGIIRTLPLEHMTDVADEDLPDLVSVVRLCASLFRFENFDGYNPYAFLMDPGDNLDDPEDDQIIGVMLSNGLICYTRQTSMVEFKEMPEDIIISHPDPTLNLEEYPFNMRSLLFTETEMWYADYKGADKALAEVDRQTVDMRRIYAVRSSFEHESFQRLRYEISRMLQDLYPEIGKKLQDIVNQIPPGPVPDDIRGQIADILTTMLREGGHLTKEEELSGEQIAQLMDSLGPLDKGMDELDDEDVQLYRYGYNTPSVRYECFNRKLDKYREKDDVHCINGKLFITPMNLATGLADNLKNYVSRITEEILRIPIKRQELLEGQMNNFISGIGAISSNAYMLGSENMVEDFGKMYATAVNYREKMNRHYDNINPQNYTEFEYKEDTKTQMAVSQRCTGKYVNLPSNWVAKFRNMNWKIYDIKGAANCIYSELDTIIAETGVVANTRTIIATTIGSEQFEGYGDRAGWELALDYYSHLWRADYKHIKTKEELLESIRYSPRHHLSMLDLSLISRAYKVKFIVLAKPNRINKTGIVCMNTTQTNTDNIILLYLQGLTDFSIIKNVSHSPEKALFQLSDLPEVLQKEWATTCVNDNLADLDPVNKLYQAAPIPAKSLLTGHTVYVSKEGRVLPNPNIPQISIKPKLIVKPKVVAAPAEPVAPVVELEATPSEQEPVAAPALVQPEVAPAKPGRKKLVIQSKRHDALNEEVVPVPPVVADVEPPVVADVEPPVVADVEVPVVADVEVPEVPEVPEVAPATPVPIKVIKKLAIRPKIAPIEIRSAAPDVPETQATKIPLKINIQVKKATPGSKSSKK